MISFSAAALLGLNLGLCVSEVQAADSWLSRAIEVDASGQAKVLMPTNRLKGGSAAPYGVRAKGDSAQTIFDITISLYNAPAGDGDPDVDNGEEQEVYEEIIEHFADSVCEQSNGAHHLGQVRLFTERNQQAASDIVWNASEQPRAHVSGFGANARHIFFGDVFPGGAGGAGGADYDMLADPEGAGYTLGHEWGHYVYGLFDEYRGRNPTETSPRQPQTTDQPTSPSIMNRQWDARGGNFEWLNHSTSDNIGNVARTAQGRVYGKSGWDVLVQAPADDPKSGNRRAQPDRTRYTTLGAVAPDASDNWVDEQLPGAQSDCRSDLNITWVEGDIELQIVLDRSGSMGGTPIINAKQAATLLVDTTAEGQTALGVASFSSSLRQDSPIQPIPDPGADVKSQINAIIDSLSTGGSTALFDAAVFALDGLQDYRALNNTAAPQVVFLLSDGGDNASRETENSVIAQYVAANVALFTFGFGSASPTGPLLAMANGTGGQYYFSPTDLAQITDAFLQANAVASDLQNLVQESRSIPPGDVASASFPVDSGLDSINLIVNYAGSVDELQLSVLDPAGMVLPADTVQCQQLQGGQTSCSAALDSMSLSSGEWTLTAENTSATDIDANINISGSPNDQGTFSARVAGFQGNEVNYPDPIILTTSVIKDLPITGVNVSAFIVDPTGVETQFDMVDDGTDGDAQAGDGIYSAILGYTDNGTYSVEVRVDNNAGMARFTTDGLQPAHSATVNGELPVPPPLPDITENFARVTKTNIVVSNVPFDDGNNSFATAVPLTPDNTPLAGVVDDPADADYYRIDNADSVSDLVVRVFNLSLGMDASLTLVAEDQVTEIATDATLLTNPSSTGYVYVPVDPADVTPTVYAIVRDVDPDASGGGYEVSAGPAINTDVPPNAAPVAGPDMAQLIEGEVVDIELLGNDTDADGDALSIDAIDESAVAASVTLTGSTVTFDTTGAPYGVAPGDTFVEAFPYTVTDGRAFTEGTVMVTIVGNTPPEALDDEAETPVDQSLAIDVLANDTDADGQALTVIDVDDSATAGTVTVNADGTVTYDPADAFTPLFEGEMSTDSFSYTVADSVGASVTATVNVTVSGVGTPEDDTPVDNDNGGGGSFGGIGLMLLGGLAMARGRRRGLRVESPTS